MSNEQIDQIKADFEQCFPIPLDVFFDRPSGIYLPADYTDFRAEVAANYNEQFQTWKAAYARYAGGGKAVVTAAIVGFRAGWQYSGADGIMAATEFGNAYAAKFDRPAPAVPDGYAVVPVEPTDEMVRRGWQSQHPARIWTLMISASKETADDI